MTRVALYRHFDAAGALLYVGITGDVGRRLNQHLKDASWAADIASISLEWFASVALAAAAERTAIRNEAPRFNVMHVGFEPSVGPFLCPETEALARDIERHCQDFGLKPSTICQKAVLTGPLYDRMCDGGDLQFGTAMKIRKWMADDRAARLSKLQESAQ